MLSSTEKKVLQLREYTGLAIRDCEIALTQANGSVDRAYQNLQHGVTHDRGASTASSSG